MAYKFVKEDERAFHVQHPDGSVFQVAKAGLAPETAKRIQMFAKGGEVEDVDQPTDPTLDQPQTAAQPQSVNIAQATQFNPFQAVQMPQAEAPTADGPADLSLAQAPGDLTSTGFSQGQGSPVPAAPQGLMKSAPSETPVADKAIADQAAAVKALGAQGVPQGQPQIPSIANDPGLQKQMGMFDDLDKAQKQAFASQNAVNHQVSDVVKSAQAQMVAQDNIYNSSMSRYQAEDERLYQQIQSKEIDPDHFYSTRSAGQKIALGLGMALAAAAGNSDVSNMLNKAIDRDIEAQKMGLGKLESQLAINMRREGNLTSAMQITKSQILTGMELQAKAITAGAGSPQAALQYQQARMQIQMMKMQLMQGASLAQAQATSTRQGLPVSQEPTALLGDPKYTKRRVLVGDQAYQVAGDDGEHMRTFENKTSEVQELVKRIDELGPDALRWKSEANLKARSLLPQLANAMAGMQSLSVNSSRISDSEIHSAEQAASDPAAFSQMFGRGVMNAEILKSLEHSRETTRAQNLLGYHSIKSPEAYGGKVRGK